MSNSPSLARVLLFSAGILVGALLGQSSIAEAANQMMFGTYSGAAKAVAVDVNGYVNVVLH